MSAPVYVAYENLDDDWRYLADKMLDGIDEAIEVCVARGLVVADYNLALHPHDGEPFFLVSVPDGPVVGCRPLTQKAEDLIQAEIPGVVPDLIGQAQEWAARVRWGLVMGIRLAADASGHWGVRDPEGVR